MEDEEVTVLVSVIVLVETSTGISEEESKEEVLVVDAESVEAGEKATSAEVVVKLETVDNVVGGADDSGSTLLLGGDWLVTGSEELEEAKSVVVVAGSVVLEDDVVAVSGDLTT